MRMLRWPGSWRSLLGVLWLVWPLWGLASAVPAWMAIDADARYDLVPQLWHAEDATGTWWPYDETGQQNFRLPAPAFAPLSGPNASTVAGFSVRPQWFHIRLHPQGMAPQRRWLVVGNPHLDTIDLLIGSEGRLISHDLGGDLLPFSHRAVPHRQHVFPIDLRPDQDLDVFLRIESGSSLDTPVQVWLPEALMRRDHAVYLLLGLYFGITAGLMGHALVLYAAMRDRFYLAYAGLRASVGLGLLALSGLGAEFVWTEGGQWNRVFQQLGLTLAGILALGFARRFLGTRERLPGLDRLLRVLAGVWVACLVSTSFWPEHRFVPVLLVLAMATMVLLIVAGFEAAGQRRIGAWQFALAWCATLAGSLLELAIRLGYWNRPDTFSQPLVIGSTIDMVLMALALGERIRAERRAKQRAQTQQIREAARLQELRRTAAEKSRLLAAVSHDLRQPVYAITLATQGLAQQPGRPVSPHTLEQIREAIASADHLLDSLHTLSRLEAGALRPRMSSFSVQPLLDRIDVIYGLQARAKGLRWAVTPGMTEVHSDPILLERILGNLAANAVRYTPQGGIVVACRPRRDALLIQFWDTGIGVPPENAEAIFGAYFRGVAETATDNGVGLGLSIVRESAALLGIEVGMRSQPGRGSCFWIRVPLALSAPLPGSVPAAPTGR
jgi:two-component system, sensor histidine kinase LadS